MSEVTGRTILLRLGISDYNATQIIQFLFTSPMTTDPKSPSVILLVRALQQNLNAMGAGIVETGYLDQVTAGALSQLAGGTEWSRWSWVDVCTMVLAQKQAGASLAPSTQTYQPAATGDYTMPFGLPDVPGGMLTYAAGAVALIYLLKKKGR